jgi:hypothetical protein
MENSLEAETLQTLPYLQNAVKILYILSDVDDSPSLSDL